MVTSLPLSPQSDEPCGPSVAVNHHLSSDGIRRNTFHERLACVPPFHTESCAPAKPDGRGWRASADTRRAAAAEDECVKRRKSAVRTCINNKASTRLALLLP
jgi:hypothetical protein